MAKKMKEEGMMKWMACCGSTVGLIHAVAGVGIGFLLASYIAIPNMVMWGWILVALGILGHLVGWNKCRHCEM